MSDLTDQIAELEKRAADGDAAKAELAKLKTKPVHPLLLTVVDETYRYVAKGNGQADRNSIMSVNASYYDQGRIFATQEQAETFLKREAAIATINRAILVSNGDWVPDWKDDNQDKFTFYLDHGCDEWGWMEHQQHQECFTFIPCHSSEALEKILSDHAAEFRAVVA